jgi:hypothetical protein
MSKIDRRTLVLGFLVMPLAGCVNPAPTNPPAYPQPVFGNYGYWMDSSVYVVTGGVKP